MVTAGFEKYQKKRLSDIKRAKTPSQREEASRRAQSHLQSAGIVDRYGNLKKPYSAR